MIRNTILGLTAAAAILTGALAPTTASAGYGYGYSSYGYSSYRSYDDCYTPKNSYGYHSSYGY